MRNNSEIHGDVAGVVKYSCGIFFMLFCFVYIFCIHGEVLNEAQFVYSHGLTTYNPVVSACVIAVVLQLTQWVITRIVFFPQKIYALSYFVPALMLTMLADINRNTIMEFSFGAWIWIAPMSVVLYFLTLVLVKKHFFENKISHEQNVSVVLYSNHIILLVLFLIIGSVTANTDVYHYELKAERLVTEHDYAAAAEVGNRSLKSSKRLSQIRMYALAKENMLPERMFSYPQYYGVDGLLDVFDEKSPLYRLRVDDMCAQIGAVCGKTVKTTKRHLELIVYNDSLTTPMAIDYYLCYLLLEKSLDEFYSKFFDLYECDTCRVPRAYQEALLLMSEMKGDSLYIIDNEIRDRFKAYKLLKAESLDSTKRRNKTRREYGDTYWWYYDFQKNGDG